MPAPAGREVILPDADGIVRSAPADFLALIEEIEVGFVALADRSRVAPVPAELIPPIAA